MTIRCLAALTALLAFALLATGDPPVPTAPRIADAVPELGKDRAVLEIRLPAGAHAKLDDTAFDGKHRQEFPGLKPGETLRKTLRVRFKEGAESVRAILIKGGWTVNLVIDPPGLLKPEIVPQTGHSAIITAIATSPDGRWLLTGSRDSTAILWDLATGRLLRQYRGHQDELIGVDFSPDGTRVLTASRDGTMVLWNGESGAVRRRIAAGVNRKMLFAAFTPDGKFIVAGTTGTDENVFPDTATALHILDAVTGTPLRTLNAKWHRMMALPGGQFLAADETSLARYGLPDGMRKRTLLQLKEGRRIVDFVVSPDGKKALVAAADHSSSSYHLLDLETASVRQVGTGSHLDTRTLSIHPEGRLGLVGSGSQPGEVCSIEFATGKELRQWKGIGETKQRGGKRFVGSFTRSGKHVLVVEGESDNSVGLYETAGGKKVRQFAGATRPVMKVVALPREEAVDALPDAASAVLWDTRAGQKVRAFAGPPQNYYLAVSPDGETLVARKGDWGQPLDLIDWRTGAKKQTIPNELIAFESVAFSADGKRLAAFRDTQGGLIWDLADGRRERLFGEDEWVFTSAFRPDGKVLLTAGNDLGVKPPHRSGAIATLWNVETGARIRSFRLTGSENIRAAAWSSDGSRILTSGYPNEKYFWYQDRRALKPDETCAFLWDVQGKSDLPVRAFRGHRDAVRAMAFSTDDRQVLTASSDGTARLWDAATGDMLLEFRGHTDKVNSVVPLPDGRRACTGSSDGTVRIWDLATGEELGRLFNLADGGDWLAITPEGLFDGSAGGRKQVAFRSGRGLKIEPVDHYFQDYFRPGLLEKEKGGGRPKPDVDFASAPPPPTVKILSPSRSDTVEQRQAELVVEVADEGGGVQGPYLFHNGTRVLVPGQAERNGPLFKRTFSVTLITGDNILEAQARTGDGARESEPARVVLRYEKPLDKPRLFVIAAGVNRYADESMNLKFAAADAKSLARLFERRGRFLYQPPVIEILENEKASRAAIREAIAAAAKRARPQDTIVLIFAGHGTMVGSRYYFIPHEFRRTPGRGQEEDVREQGLPGDEIADLVNTVPALKRVLIFDTCHSAGALTQKWVSRNPFALRGAIERLSRTSGIFAIAAASVTAEAQEVEELGHGVLSYALLAGLKAAEGGPLDDKPIRPASADQVVDILEWFGYAAA